VGDIRLDLLSYCIVRWIPLRTCAVLLSLFSFIFFSSAGRSGRTGEPGEGIVDVSLGLCTHGRALQYLTRWLSAVA